MDRNLSIRAISDGLANSEYPVFGLAINLGSITSTQSPLVWAVGYVRDPSIQYMTPAGSTQLRSPYYAMQYHSIDEVVRTFSVPIHAPDELPWLT